MSDPKIEGYVFKPGFSGMAKDTGSDQTMFKGVHWGKAMTVSYTHLTLPTTPYV